MGGNRSTYNSSEGSLLASPRTSQASPGRVYTTVQRPVLYLDLFPQQGPQLRLDVYALQSPVLHLDVSTLQGPELHLGLSTPHLSLYCRF
jgi:hypothetical protein